MLRTFTAVSLLLAAGCGSDGGDDGGGAGGSGGGGLGDCSVPGADHPLTVGKKKSGPEGVSVELRALSPAPPAQFDNDWTVGVTDASGAVEGGTVIGRSWMPDHGHSSPKPIGVTEAGAGSYDLSPVNLHMPGLWEVTVEVTTQAGTEDAVTFQFCIGE